MKNAGMGIFAVAVLGLVAVGGCRDYVATSRSAGGTAVAGNLETRMADDKHEVSSGARAAGDARADESGLEKATFGAGCFWGVEERFRQTSGVVRTAVGYCGGTVANPSYEQVCTDRTGHAEVVQVEYDPAVVSYEQLLDVFWNGHNPTTRNRQGPDVGTQYRSVIFHHSPEQEAAARASKEKLDASGKFRAPIVTEIEPAKPFYRAEEYHQQYLAKRGQTTCGTGDGQ